MMCGQFLYPAVFLPENFSHPRQRWPRRRTTQPTSALVVNELAFVSCLARCRVPVWFPYQIICVESTDSAEIRTVIEQNCIRFNGL